MNTSRRSFLKGATAIAATAAVGFPAVVEAHPVVRSGLPVGYIVHRTTPRTAGLLPCDGRTLSRSAYPDLFAVLGNAYGPADDRDSFRLPKLTDLALCSAAPALRLTPMIAVA